MERIGSKADRVLSNVVRIAYLIGIGLTVFSYFTNTFFQSNDLSLVLGAGLTVAFTIHEFLAQRRVISLWNRLSRLRKDAEERRHVRQQFAWNAVIGAVILLADVFFGIGYYQQLLMHQNLIPVGVESVVRPLVLVLFFWLSSLLAPVEDDPAQIMSDTQQDMLLKLSKVTRQQWNTRMDRAVDEGRNLVPVTADILQLTGEVDKAFLVDRIEQALERTEAGSVPVKGVRKPTLIPAPTRKQPGRKAPTIDSQFEHQNEQGIEHPKALVGRV